MFVRTIISLDRQQLRELKTRAKAQGVSVAAFIRKLVTEGLQADRPATPVPRSTFERLVGLGSSGRADVSDRHDALLADAIRTDHDG